VGGKREAWISGLRSPGWFFFAGSSGSLDEGSWRGHSGFLGYLDAHAGSSSPVSFDDAEVRVAETRPVNRALRKVTTSPSRSKSFPLVLSTFAC
jgi:hypothetical protein